MAKTYKRRIVQTLLLATCIAVSTPVQVFAQPSLPIPINTPTPTPTDPGKDPFALSNESLRYFQGYTINEDLKSLFSGEHMKGNGMFAPSFQQLGGASPNLTAPIVDNEDEVKTGPTYIVITSEYSPSGDLTSQSEITLKVTVENIGESLAEDIVFRACVQDNYITLLEEPAPSPPFTNDPLGEIEAEEEAENEPEIEPEDGEAEEAEEVPADPPGIQDPTVNDCYMELVWETLEDGEPITLDPGESATFSWSFQAVKDDVVIRWRLVAEYGAGQSVLRHWIPVKNPNPTGGVAPPGTVGGVNPCAGGAGGSGPYPAMSQAQIVPLFKQNWNIELIDSTYSYTDPQFEGILKLWWETLIAIECTPFVQDTTKGNVLRIHASTDAGGWGYYPGNYNLHMNLGNIAGGRAENIKQNFVHELGHVWRGSNPDKDADFTNNIHGQGSPNPYVSGYHINNSEDLSSALGYYAVRESNEWHDGGSGPQCAEKNPYDWGQTKYYEWVKTNAFGGVEFGSPPPNPPTSC